MEILGLHHITLVSGNAQRTLDFYTRTLGLRFIKQTVNFDAPSTYHLYFGDEVGHPGTILTFFEWPDAPKGHPGIGGTHHFALGVSTSEGVLQWKRRLTDQGTDVYGPYDRGLFLSIYFRDPDGVRIEISAPRPVDDTLPENSNELEKQTWPEPVEQILPGMPLTGPIHHISALSSDLERTDAFYSGTLGLELVHKSVNRENIEQPHWFWGFGKHSPAMITYFEENPQRTKRAQLGRSQTHHFAMAVADEDEQLAWRERLLRAGIQVTAVLDRVYFKSIYMTDPDGHIVELATAGPGFAVDEAPETLGQSLKLPPWLEIYREQIQRGLIPLQLEEASAAWTRLGQQR